MCCCFFSATTCSDVMHQAYLLEGLVRWNRDREAAIVRDGESYPCTYSGKLQQHVNKLSEQVPGRKLFPDFVPPRPYTGMSCFICFKFSN